MAQFLIVHTDAPADAPLPEERKVLADSGLDIEFVPRVCRSEEDVIELTRDADAVLNARSQMTRRVIENLRKCKVMVRYGVGVDTFDIPAATEHGIVLANVPDFCIEEVSNHALMLLLACAKKLVRLDRMIKAGEWAQKRSQIISPMGRIVGQTLGLVAFGKIPRALARKALDLKLRCLAYDPYVSPEVMREHGVEPATLEELLRESDCISVHAPLTAETRHMFGEREFRTMKPSAYFINTSRGPVVNEAALIKALREGWIAGAGLDVFEVEPLPTDSPLVEFENVILLPHSASYSDEGFQELRTRVAQEAVRVLKGYWPQNLVNPAVREKVNLREG